ncbi:MAG: signal recognition particle-docking protein FtsY [Pseudomonadota bacterium]|nr:MAG: signal recognition particle-docking protein FtsY [Pseudomonadota bacterium]
MFGLFKRKQAPQPPQSDSPSQAPASAAVVEPRDEAAAPLAVEPQAVPVAAAAQAERASWFDRLRAGLKKTGSQLSGLFGGGKIDEALFEELETALLMADAGVDATNHLLQQLRARVRKERLETAEQLKEALADELTKLLQPLEVPPVDVTNARPFVVMIAGVNGAGKTTSIGKLAKYFQSQGLSVLLAAGDTFRAAAREQLAAWGERNNVAVIAQQGGDPAAVIYDAFHAARARGVDVLIADTAGRLPTQLHLMEELKKVKRVIAKVDPSAPHAVWLVIDANTGQNAIAQVKAFDDAIGLTGLILTKLDGTAKGGVVAAIARTRPIPLLFVGVGEGIDDLRPFAAADFARALLG